MIPREISGDALSVPRKHLAIPQPAMRLPHALPEQHGDEQQALGLLALQEGRHFLLNTELGSEEIGRDQENSRRGVDRWLSFVMMREFGER